MNDRSVVVVKCSRRIGISALNLLFLIATPTLGQVPPPSSAPGGSTARPLVHVLDYVAQDYSVAVSGGEVINAAEYAEMVAFGKDVAVLLDELAAAGVLPEGDSLQDATSRLPRARETDCAPELR